jgi:membrane fusion protein, macrolide-specific efflux system
MKKFKKKEWLIVAGALALVVILILIITKKSNGDEYRKVTVTQGNIQVTILSTGTVQPENRLEIKPQVSGRVEQVMVKEGQYVKKGATLALISSTERAALMDAARARGPEEEQKWEEYYKPATIIAPINGMIILRSIEPGQTFTTADAVLVMSDRLTVKAQVDETDIAKVRLKQEASIILDAYPKEIIPAHVDQIAYDAKTINSVTTYIVDVLPNKAPSFMLSGMTANVTFTIDNKENILLLPIEAVKNKDNTFYVLTEDPKSGHVVEKKVVTGVNSNDGRNVEIVSGLLKDDVVLIAKPKTKSKETNPFMPARKKN